MTTAARAQLTIWMTVRVTRNPFADISTTGSASIGGSQKSRVSAAMRASSISTSATPSVATTMAFGELIASGMKTLRDSTVAVSAA